MSELDPRYPIGRFTAPERYTPESRAAAVTELRALPAAMRAAVAGLDAEQLDTPYREGGWTARQLVHHVADSHLNAYIRHKLAVTEDEPTIKPYSEKAWSELEDARVAGPEVSLALLSALHARWAAFLDTLPASAFDRGFVHPESKRRMSVDWSLAMYAWHGHHHVAQITTLRAARGW